MKNILAFCILMISVMAMAVPAKRVKKTITLADGTQKEVVFVGDENIHFYLDAENNAYTCDAEGVYVKSDLRKLEKTWKERLAQRNKHRLEKAKARGMLNNTQNLREPGTQRRAHWGAETNPISGNPTGLVILINFSDKDLNANHGQEYYDRFFNEKGFSADNNHGSVHDYFSECSYGQFNPTFDVYGPVTVSKSYTYYGRNDTNGYDMFPAEMVIEACTKVAEMGVDFSKYDWDGDCMVDQVLCIYAGYGENSYAPANTLWPHECTLTEEAWYGDGDGPVTFNGVTIDTYAISCELDGTSGDTPAGIGVACHEFSHCMCIPDFYDTKGTGHYGMDVWDLMDYGSYAGNQNGNCPPPYTSYERMYCGWLTPKVLSEPCMVTDMGTLYQSPEAYIIYNDANPYEYYMLENRQQEGFFASDAAKGMLVLHVYFDADVWITNSVNNSDVQRMTIIPADAVLSHFSNNTDTWPGLTGNTALTDISFPAATLYTPNPDGVRFMSKPIEDIVDQNGKISFMFNGGMKIDSPVASEASAVTSYGFTAQWNAVENAANYTVMIKAEDLIPQQYSIKELTLMQEDFSKFNNGKTTDGSTDVGEQLDDYTVLPDWVGSKLYTTPQDEVKMGSARNGGSIYSPYISTESETMTLVFTARKYRDDTSPLEIIFGEYGEGGAIGEVELTSEPKQFLFTVAKGGLSFWWGLSCEGRCYISEMSAYEGELTEEDFAAGVVYKKNITTSMVDTEDTSYAFTNLSNQRLYTYSVCAVNGNTHSKWSNEVEVMLPEDPEGIDQMNIDHSILNMEHYYTLDGVKHFSPQRGINIIRRADGSVRKIIR